MGRSEGGEGGESGDSDSDDGTVCLGESFFINQDYQLTRFTFGSQVLQLLCLQSASTDFDLTEQLVWPGATLLNDYLSLNPHILHGSSVIELGSGVGVTGILCSRFCRQVMLTDHNDEVLKILKKNIEIQESSETSNAYGGLSAEKLEWGNSSQLSQILQKHPGGFDLLLRDRGEGRCKFILAYVSRTKVMDVMVPKEAIRHGLNIKEIAGTRSVVAGLQGVIYEITL